jgi:hypothetical protein
VRVRALVPCCGGHVAGGVRAKCVGAGGGGRLAAPLRHPGARLRAGGAPQRRRPARRQHHGGVAVGGATAAATGAPALRRRHGRARQHRPPAHAEGALRGGLLQQHGPQEDQRHRQEKGSRCCGNSFFHSFSSIFLMIYWRCLAQIIDNPTKNNSKLCVLHSDENRACFYKLAYRSYLKLANKINNLCKLISCAR